MHGLHLGLSLTIVERVSLPSSRRFGTSLSRKSLSTIGIYPSYALNWKRFQSVLSHASRSRMTSSLTFRRELPNQRSYLSCGPFGCGHKTLLFESSATHIRETYLSTLLPSQRILLSLTSLGCCSPRYKYDVMNREKGNTLIPPRVAAMPRLPALPLRDFMLTSLLMTTRRIRSRRIQRRCVCKQ